MDTFDRIMVLVIIIAACLLTHIITVCSARHFTCEQMGKVYEEGRCVVIKETANVSK